MGYCVTFKSPPPPRCFINPSQAKLVERTRGPEAFTRCESLWEENIPRGKAKCSPPTPWKFTLMCSEEEYCAPLRRSEGLLRSLCISGEFWGVHRRLWVLAASVAEHLVLKLFADHLQGNQTPHWKHGFQSVRSGIKTMKTPLVRNLLF